MCGLWFPCTCHPTPPCLYSWWSGDSGWDGWRTGWSLGCFSIALCLIVHLQQALPTPPCPLPLLPLVVTCDIASPATYPVAINLGSRILPGFVVLLAQYTFCFLLPLPACTHLYLAHGYCYPIYFDSGSHDSTLPVALPCSGYLVTTHTPEFNWFAFYHPLPLYGLVLLASLGPLQPPPLRTTCLPATFYTYMPLPFSSLPSLPHRIHTFYPSHLPIPNSVGSVPSFIYLVYCYWLKHSCTTYRLHF